VLAESLINLNGIGFVSKLLEEDSNIILFLEVDSAGNVLKIVKTKGEFPSIMQSGLLSFLINEKICFKICYETLPGKSDEEMFQLTKQEIRSSHRTSFLISISFPGSLMSLYQYEKEKLEQQNIELSKIVYLKVMISRFLINRI
jgi:hypothetical protein